MMQCAPEGEIIMSPDLGIKNVSFPRGGMCLCVPERRGAGVADFRSYEVVLIIPLCSFPRVLRVHRRKVQDC